jgi:hypothetical protein
VCYTSVPLVPSAAVEGLVVMEVCPAGGLMVQWSAPDSRLLGGPVEDVQYVLSYSPQGGSPSSSTFSYNTSLMVSTNSEYC